MNITQARSSELVNAMIRLLITLMAALTVTGALFVSEVQGQKNANSVKVPPGRYTLAHATPAYRNPSTTSERILVLAPGASIWVTRDLGPWLGVRLPHEPRSAFIRKSSVLNQPRASASTPVVEILSPRDGTRLRQQQPSILLKGRVTPPAFRDPNLDVFFILDVSGSTRKYAGLNFLKGLSTTAQRRSFITDPGHYSETDNSILGGAVGATRRLIAQLDPKTTRVGLITVRGTAKLVDPLTDDFGWLHLQLKEVLRAGSQGGTHLADGLRMGIRELAGLGTSKPRHDSTKIQMLLTDGYPTLPTGGGRAATRADIDVAITSAGIAKKAGVKVHVLGLGQGAAGRPLAAVEIARATGGIYTAVTRPDDIFNVLEKSSTIGVTHIEITNETMGEPATEITLGNDGYFTSVVPVRPGMNRMKVLAHTTGGRGAVAYLSVDFEVTEHRSLELDVFLENSQQRVLKKLVP